MLHCSSGIPFLMTLFCLLIPETSHGKPTFVSQGPAPSQNSFEGGTNSDVGPISPVVVSPFSASTIYVGGINGGIWKTTDGGISWIPQLDNQNNLAVISIDLDSTDVSGNTLIAGTGIASNGSIGTEENFIRGPNPSGIYRTTDGGATWSTVPGNATLIHSSASVVARGSTLLVGACEPTEIDTIDASTGLFRSTNSGASFTNISFGSSITPNSPVTSIAGSSSNSAKLWAAATDPVAKNKTALFYSSNTGLTWTSIFGAAKSAGLIQSTNQTLIKVATGPNDTLAILVINTNVAGDDKITGAFWSNNNGTTWKQIYKLSTSTIDFNRLGQAVINSSIAIDPNNPDLVYIAGTYINDPANGFPGIIYQFDRNQPINSATPIFAGANGTFAHSGSRMITFDSNGNLLLSTDGGIDMKNIPYQTSSWQTLSGNLSLTQGYSAAYDANFNRIMMASQDVGVSLQNAPNNSMFTTLHFYGNGLNARVNDQTSSTSSYFYSSRQSLSALNRLIITGGIASDPVFLNLTGGNPQFQFPSRIILNRMDPTKIALGGSVLTGTNNSFAVSLFTDDLSSTTFALTPADTMLIYSNPSAIGAMSYGTVDQPNALLVGTLIGTPNLAISANPGITALSGISAFTYGAPNDVVFDTRTMARFFAIGSDEHLYSTTNTGTSFTDLTASLPPNLTGTNSHLLSLEFISYNGVNALLAGGLSNQASLSSIAVANSDNSGTLSPFTLFGDGIPNTFVNQMTVNPKSDTLIVCTFGRGAYLLYDLSSNFTTATELWLGKANNDSNPDPVILSGNRPLMKFGTGIATLTGSPSYTGSTTVYGGTLALLNSTVGSSSSPVKVLSGATLRGTGHLFTSLLTVDPGATIRAGNSTGVLNITGPIVLNGITVLELNHTASSIYNVTGSATLNGPLDVVIDPDDYTTHPPYTFFVASGGINGRFSETIFPIGFTGSLLYSSTAITLRLQALLLNLAGLSGNSLTLAKYLNTFEFDPLFQNVLNCLVNLTPNQEAAALIGISPVRNAIGTYVSTMTTSSMINIVNARLTNHRMRRFLQSEFSTKDLEASNAFLPQRKCESALKCDIWLEGFGNWTHFHKQHQTPAFDFSGTGVVGGFDRFGESVSAGLALAWATDNVHQDHDLGSQQINSMFLGPYATYCGDRCFCELGAFFTGNFIDTVRHIYFPGFNEKANASHKSYQFTPHLTFGCIFDMKDAFILEPYANFDWITNFEEKYKEHGAGVFDMRFKKHFSSLLRSELGLGSVQKYGLKNRQLYMREKIAYVNQAIVNTGFIRSGFVVSPQSIAVSTFPFNQSLGLCGLELWLQGDKSFISLEYDGEFGSGYVSNQGIVKIGRYF